ncbi:hypothetical protein T265_09206 [Opisthorchis viverrini]|uniref:Uncharacterized protein n=1 Tax=Opisthorchis viverrini TaxID=6198 RepID=A0A074Z6G8_OPIVI|nr:hypothetical protein T265_09206 [Opisthorchis viverrini]KER22761.1 hypothetical protein T265_09206 [Opisthorchis viverrini]
MDRHTIESMRLMDNGASRSLRCVLEETPTTSTPRQNVGENVRTKWRLWPHKPHCLRRRDQIRLTNAPYPLFPAMERHTIESMRLMDNGASRSLTLVLEETPTTSTPKQNVGENVRAKR